MGLTIKLKEPTNVDLNKFIGLSTSRINWGDGAITSNTTSHNYSQAGLYTIITDFSGVEEIGDNFRIDNLTYFRFVNDFVVEDENDYSNSVPILKKIGNKFLYNSSLLYALDLSIFTNIETIGNNFLENTPNITLLKLPYIKNLIYGKDISLESWGNNALNNSCVIYCGICDDYYKNADVWKNKSSLMKKQNFYYDMKNNEAEDIIYNKTPYLLDNKIKISNYSELEYALNSHDILLESELQEKVDPVTRQVYYLESDIKKTLFVYRYKVAFIDNGTVISRYYINRLFKAVSIKNGFLEVDTDYINSTYFYKENDDTSNIGTKYMAIDPIIEDEESKSNYIETNIYQIKDWKDYSEPNYARGYLRFGIIDENNITTINYEGDHETGLIIKIYANKSCRYLKIYKNEINPSTMERKYVYINTDLIPENKILSGDYIEINTNIGKKSAILYRKGKEYNILNAIDKKSTWLTLRNGNNDFFCYCDPNYGSIFNIDINITYSDLYEGI